MHHPHGFCVLINDRLQCSSAFLDIPQKPPEKADIGIGIDEFPIVGSVEADPLNGKLSNVTPLAEAILEHKVGQTVEVLVDEPYQVKILEIR